MLSRVSPSGFAHALSVPQEFKAEFGRRATAMAAALAIQLLLLLALLSLGVTIEPTPEAELTEVSLAAREVAEAAPPEPAPDFVAPQPTERESPQPVETPAPAPQPTQVPVAVIPAPTAPRVPPPAEPPRTAPRAVVRDEVFGPPDTGAPRSDDSERVGTAPNGEPLYAAQWYREPGDEFHGYLSTASPGWGLIACRTIPNFYVTDCVALDETPGSRLTRSMLAGAGVLRVRPPRLGGRSLVGAWVRIRVDYTVRR